MVVGAQAADPVSDSEAVPMVELEEPTRVDAGGRVMGVDFGEARIGVALSDPTRTLATPLTVVREKDKGRQIRGVASLVAEHEVAVVVVGVPYRLDGTVGPMAELVERFAKRLEQEVAARVVRWDERFSSLVAEEALREADGGRRRKGKRGDTRDKGRIDQAAAAILLQEWLDTEGRREGGA